MAKYHQNQGRSIFEEECTKQALTEMGNPLDILSQVVDFEIFRKDLETTVLPIERKSNAGRPPKDPVFMFKVVLLKHGQTLAWSDADSAFGCIYSAV